MKNGNLSCYYYETTKGFHIVSPVLLTFRTWLFRIESLKKKVPEYRFGAIRISKRPTDIATAYYQNWNNRKQKESFSLHALMSEIFFITNVKMVKPKKTKLNYIWYDQLNFKSSSIDSSKKAGAICFSTHSVGFQNRDILNKEKQTFDYDLYNKWRSRMDDPVTYDECIEAQFMINRSNLSNIMRCRDSTIGIAVGCTIITYLVCISGVLPFV